jgi:glycosyltransferase involved in cell wall biosynthesis
MRAPVLHVIPFLWSGAGAVVTRLCEAQRRNGPVEIVTTGQADGQSDWRSYRAALRRAGVAHHTINFFHRGDGQFWSSVMQLETLLRRLRPAVIHAHAGVPACALAVARTTAAPKARVIGQMYSWGEGRPEWMNRQDAWGLAQADRVVCSARAYWDLLLRYGVPRRKLTYLPWGLPLDLLPQRLESPPAARKRADGNTENGPRIGFIGRIEPRKGQLDLVHAFARVRRALPGAELELIGPVADVGYAAAVRAAVRAHGLGKAVHLAGEAPEVAARLRTWDLFVSLSSDEGQGLAVLEAMAVGVPVIARPVAGIADFLVDRRTGFTVGRPDARSVSVAIADAWSNRAARRTVTRQARRLVERTYDWNATVRAFERLYWG